MMRCQVISCLASRMDSATRITYRGPPAYAGALAAALEAKGLSADYTPSFETKDLATAMNAVAVIFAVTGSLPEIVSTVRAFMARFPGTRVEGLPAEPDQTIAERLAAVDKLRTDGVITREEHAQQRSRILGEL